jgi:Arc-like DNA binding domain
MNRAQAQKTTLRMPADVVEWLQQRAAHNITSMTAEIVRVVRDRIAQEGCAEKAIDR